MCQNMIDWRLKQKYGGGGASNKDIQGIILIFCPLKTLPYANKENSSKILLSFVRPNDEHFRPILVAEAVRPPEGGGDVVLVHLLLLPAGGAEIEVRYEYQT